MLSVTVKGASDSGSDDLLLISVVASAVAFVRLGLWHNNRCVPQQQVPVTSLLQRPPP